MHVVMHENVECERVVVHQDVISSLSESLPLRFHLSFPEGVGGDKLSLFTQFFDQIFQIIVDNTVNFRNFVSGNLGLNPCLILCKNLTIKSKDTNVILDYHYLGGILSRTCVILSLKQSLM
jgi:hypothetical protein